MQENRLLLDGMGGVPGFASVGGFFEEEAARAVLGVGCGLVFDVGHAAGFFIAAEKFYVAVAIFAAELCIRVVERDGDGFYLP
jgi:hypothetical protein